MPTGTTIINAALRQIGIRQITSTEQDEALEALNNLLRQWSTERLTVFSITEESFSLPSGQITRTIGTGGNFDTSRPQIIVDAFIRDTNNYDYPVDVSMSQEEYNCIAAKSTVQGRPRRLFYKSEYPLGKIYFDLKPENTETLFLFSWKPLTEFSSSITNVALPGEYEEALKYNLAVRLAPEYQITPDNIVIQMAVITKKSIKEINAPIVEPVRFDSALTGSRRTGASGYPAILRG